RPGGPGGPDAAGDRRRAARPGGGPVTARTQEQILARFRDIDPGDDWLGFRRMVLIDSMTLDTLRQALPDFDTNGRDDYVKPEDLEQKARAHLTFGIGKTVA